MRLFLASWLPPGKREASASEESWGIVPVGAEVEAAGALDELCGRLVAALTAAAAAAATAAAYAATAAAAAASMLGSVVEGTLKGAVGVGRS